MRRCCLLVLTPVLLAACGSTKHVETSTTPTGADESAARFAVRVQAQLKRGRFAQAWRTLHPAEKREVSAHRLASCYPKNQFPGTVTFRATKTRDVRWLVPGTSSSVPAKEVTVTVTSAGGPKQTLAQHLVRVSGGWAWMLSKQYFSAAKAGSC
jgi:hypothetical protein